MPTPLNEWAFPSTFPLFVIVPSKDFTKRHESVAIDSVYIRAAGNGTTTSGGGSSSLPICAQGSPDAMVCTC